MARVMVLCVEDEAEVRAAMVRDLDVFADAFIIESAEDVAEAQEVMDAAVADGNRVGLILCDHVLPRETGVDFLIRLSGEARWSGVRKILITGQAGHKDTIEAINGAHLHYYIEKPWRPEALQQVVREQLTEFVLAEEELDLLPFVEVLNGPKIMDAIADRGFV